LVYNTSGSGDPYNINVAQALYVAGNYQVNTSAGTGLSGTWRNRGYSLDVDNSGILRWYYLFTRVA
jgi:hypothetical protein